MIGQLRCPIQFKSVDKVHKFRWIVKLVPNLVEYSS